MDREWKLELLLRSLNDAACVQTFWISEVLGELGTTLSVLEKALRGQKKAKITLD